MKRGLPGAMYGAVTKMLTGLAPSDPEFERRWSEFLNELGRRLQEPEEHG